MFDHLRWRIEQRRVKHLYKHPEAEMVALVRCSGEQNQVAGVLLEHLGELEVLGLYEFAVLSVSRQVMCFVKYHQVPRRSRFQSRHAGTHFQGVYAGDQHVVLFKCVRLAVSDIPFAAENLKVQMKNFIQLAMPVVNQTSRHNH